MNDLIKNMKKKAILPAAALIAAAAIGTTFAWQTWDLSVTNQLRSHETVVEVNEEGWDPGTGVKPVKFVNTGSSSVFLRVSYTEYWEINRGDDRYLLTNIQDGQEVAHKDWTANWDSDWTNGGDGWYYYNKVLKSTDKEGTGLILNKVDFKKLKDKDESGNYVYRDYIDGDYHLYFKAEAVQCSDGSNTLNSEEVNRDATQKLFGKTATVDVNDNETVIWQ